MVSHVLGTHLFVVLGTYLLATLPKYRLPQISMQNYVHAL